ncbi:hypothetical protein [Pseudomonas botevensis]|uniref:hypothetical protein n=1 Tax=Pseudomonas botevensis TaxID=2842352 RepID=UPI001C3D4402|nr:hypothetical protein [Pseudomonas botevensis]MBV4474827.1 hypothetical protein [Pseudomonas botevensis]
MALSSTQIHDLDYAIRNYSFPLDYYDYNLAHTHNPQKASSIRHLEAIIQSQLKSGVPVDTEQGLGNIIYWGNATAGYRDSRFANFRTRIGAYAPYPGFNGLIAGSAASLGNIRRLGYPGYSGISFVSKILMFLDPQNYCVLDLQISKLRRTGRPIPRALDRLKVYTTRIPITRNNELVYGLWCDECRSISQTYYTGRYRVADIERGFFELIKVDMAKALAIYSDF